MSTYKSDATAPRGHFKYLPLDHRVDCMRLLWILPSNGFYDPVECQITHVPFSQKPKYDALSYTWGSEEANCLIRIHGRDFPVRRNLLDALRYLRHFARDRYFWIDAICINQSDIHERNRQVHIMPHIYARANKVAAWLGAKYAKYYPEEYVRITGRKPEKSLDWLKGLSSIDREMHMLADISSDDYWNRVWIIQEIGKAQSISVCFGARAYTWDKFMSAYRRTGKMWLSGKRVNKGQSDARHRDSSSLRAFAQSGRLGQLNAQLESKFTGGHTLRKLILTHRSAKCQDPRDKIYGFVGLATDAHGFPMDYGKSLFEVWKDTMSFVYSRGLVGPSDIVVFGRAINDILEGRATTGDMETLANGSLQPTPLNPILPAITAKIRTLSAITYVGPSPHQLISSLDEADSWNASIVNNYPQNMSNALAHSDDMVRRIIGLPGDRIPKVESTVEAQLVFTRCKGSVQGNYCLVGDTDGPDGDYDAQKMRPMLTPRLFQLQATDPNDESMDMLLGIGPGGLMIGDLVCKIPGVDRHIIIRLEGDHSSFQIIGTSIFGGDLPENNSLKVGQRSTPTAMKRGVKQLIPAQVHGLFSLSMRVEELYAVLYSMRII